eukprot:4027700-Pleurochrysis_carterae.AAC.1
MPDSTADEPAKLAHAQPHYCEGRSHEEWRLAELDLFSPSKERKFAGAACEEGSSRLKVCESGVRGRIKSFLRHVGQGRVAFTVSWQQ